MSGLRRAAGLIASLLIAAMGICGLVTGSRAIGLSLFAVGAALASWQGWRLYATRPDPYDLKRLWDPPPEENEPLPEDELLRDEEGTIYCHHCGNAVAGPFARCPQCGGKLR